MERVLRTPVPRLRKAESGYSDAGPFQTLPPNVVT
jgi:hypothetical protein